MSPNRYVLLPQEGPVVPEEGPEASALSSLPQVRSTEEPAVAPMEAADGRDVRFVDAARENGPRLVEVDAQTAEAINRSEVPLRAVPEVEYPPPNRPLEARDGAVQAAGATQLSVTCTDTATGKGVAGTNVVAFTDFASRAGDGGTTDASGTVNLTLGSSSVERLYAYPPPGYWGAFDSALTVNGPLPVALTPIELGFVDCVRHFYGESDFDPERGVKVGVIDSGVGPHTDLNLVGGRNTVTGEHRDDFGDPEGHGTHVAGLIGSNGSPPSGLRGVAPGVALHAYRVFPAGGEGATNYAILKAMILAANDGCDIVNLSLGGGPADEVVEDAVTDARNAGMLVVVATGNDDRAPVNYPAAYPLATAVTAMGREGTFPAGSLDDAEVVRPPAGADPADFIAGFSNVGEEVATTGPGVGALSTMPGNAFGAMSGTSMAAPVVSGAVACLLSRDSSIFGQERNAARSQAIEDLLRSNCKPLNFGPEFEGSGLPDPGEV